MKNFLKNIFFASLPSFLLTFLILELFLRFIIPASQFPNVKFDREYNMLTSDNRAGEGIYTIGKFAEQRGFWRINNYGWNSPIDYHSSKSKTRVAVIGDSFVEALQVDNDKNFVSILRDRLKDSMEVYSFGISDAPLSHYLHIYRYVVKEFDPDIIIVNIIHNDFDQSVINLRPEKKYWFTLDIQGDKVQERLPTPYKPSTLRRLMGRSALVRYLYKNLHIETIPWTLKGTDKNYNANIEVSGVRNNTELIRKAVTYILRRFDIESEGRRLFFVMDAPRSDIYANRLEQSEVYFLNKMFAELCKEQGFELLDLTQSMVNDYAAHGIPFSSELDWHWDEYGHAFVAQQIIDTFFSF